MVDKNQIIEQIIEELNFRSREGYPLLKKSSHIELLSEILTELGLSSIKHELIENLLIEDVPIIKRKLKTMKKNVYQQIMTLLVKCLTVNQKLTIICVNFQVIQLKNLPRQKKMNINMLIWINIF